MEETISLQDIFKTLKKRFKLIISTTVGAALIATIISFFFLVPVYQATSQVLVNQKKTEMTQQVTSQDIQSDLQLINTYYEVIKSPAILNLVITDLKLQLSPTELASKITVNSANNSQVINVSIQDESHEMAVTLANKIVQVFQTEVPKLMNVDNVNILAPAELVENPSPIKPNKMLTIAVTTVLGLLIGIAIAFLLQYFDKTVKTEQDIEELLQLPVIGLVSPIPEQDVVNEQILQRRRSNPSNRKRVGL